MTCPGSPSMDSFERDSLAAPDLWTRDDGGVTNGHPLYGTENHQQGFLAHHWDILAHAFRAGSEE
ncbi:MAG TPA: hypothetical protein ENK11_06280 [Phycisphaerales bacterium]|nr:hypothetical protein [Phycisphaerales bacterium]